MPEPQSPISEQTLAQLLRDAEHAHAEYERQLGEWDEDWPSWYAHYIVERLRATTAPHELASLEARYDVPAVILEDLLARRRAGARDQELVNLICQPDRGGLDEGRARQLVSELPR